MKVVALAGGTGGAKLAAGIQEVAGGELTVIANTGDDIETLGVHVSPDPDLVTYWLADQIDEDRGWGIQDDSFTVFERAQELGAPDWFGLSDRDLAACLERRRRLDDGERLTDDRSRVWPRSLGAPGNGAADVRRAGPDPDPDAAGWRGFQEYLIQDRAEPEIEEVEFAGRRRGDARPPRSARRSRPPT